MTRWVTPKAKGIPSVKAMALNHHALELVAHWHCPKHDYPKTVCIDDVRTQARYFEGNLGLGKHGKLS